MPVYDYDCAACGPFTALRPMAEYQEPSECPGCGSAAPRVLLTAPGLAMMDGARRTASQTNERSSHAPRQISGHTHGAGCGCGSSGNTAAKSFPGSRPWMISH